MISRTARARGAILFAVLLGTTSALGGTTVLAGQPSQVVTRMPMDRATCASFVADFKANPYVFDEATRELIRVMKDTDCYFQVETGTSAVAPLGVQSAAASTSCRTSYKTYALMSLGVEIATARTDMYWCNDPLYALAWHDEATHYEWCRVTTAPLWGGGSDWCGAETNYASIIKMGQNFHIFAYVTPWWNRYGWTRFDGYANSGTTSASYGYCCN